MASETTITNKETKRQLACDFDRNLTADHTQDHVFKLGPDNEEVTCIRVKRSSNTMGPETPLDNEELLVPMRNYSISKDSAGPDDFDNASPISDDSQALLLSTPRTSVTPGSLSRKLQDIPLALTTPSRKAARDRFVAGLQAGSLNGYGKTDDQNLSAPSESGSSVPSLPPTPTKTKAKDIEKGYRESLEAIEDRLSTSLSFDGDAVTKDDIDTKPIEELPEKLRSRVEEKRREWAVQMQLLELNQNIIKGRSSCPKVVDFPSGNVKNGSVEEESRFLNDKLKKGHIHVINCLNCELKGLPCPIRRPNPGFPMMNRYPHCWRCEREGKSLFCLMRRTATEEEKNAGDWQIKLLRTQHDDDKRWRKKRRYLEELLGRHSSKLIARCFAPLNPALLPHSRSKWLDQQLLAGYGLRPAFDEPVRPVRKEEADSANLAPWMMANK